MLEPNPRTSSRPTIFFVVVALHAAVVALLLQSARSRHGNGPAAERPLQLLFLPATKTPMVHVENVRPQQLSTNIAIALCRLRSTHRPKRAQVRRPTGVDRQ